MRVQRRRIQSTNMPPEEKSDLGAWQTVDPTACATWFAAVEVPWWIAGGWALDLYFGRQSRTHGDLDVGILRRDVGAVRERLSAWEMFEAKDGTLTRLELGKAPRREVNSLWCRPADSSLWTVQLLLDESADDAWIYRRKPSIRRPLSTAIRITASGLPYLAPEIQLLYKARGLRPRDQSDFELIAPLLEASARDWLVDALHRCEPEHPWISALRSLV